MRFTLFDTPIGRCAIVWGERGVRRVQLPEADDGALRARIARCHPGAAEAAPAPPIERAIGRIVALLHGERILLDDVALDLEGVPAFDRRVYEAARGVPPGMTRTYGELAKRLGAPGASRAVGRALGRNPFAIVVPCHRIVRAGGRLGGFSAHGGASTKERMLSIELAPMLPLPRD